MYLTAAGTALITTALFLVVHGVLDRHGLWTQRTVDAALWADRTVALVAFLVAVAVPRWLNWVRSWWLLVLGTALGFGAGMTIGTWAERLVHDVTGDLALALAIVGYGVGTFLAALPSPAQFRGAVEQGDEAGEVHAVA